MIKSSLSVTSLLLCLTLRHIIFAENKTRVIKEGKTEPVNNKKQISEAEKLKCSVRKSWATPVLYTTTEFSTPSSGHHSHFHNKAQERQIQHTLKWAARYTCPKMFLNFFSPPSASFLSRDVPVARIHSHIRSDNRPPYQIPFCLTPYLFIFHKSFKTCRYLFVFLYETIPFLDIWSINILFHPSERADFYYI